MSKLDRPAQLVIDSLFCALSLTDELKRLEFNGKMNTPRFKRIIITNGKAWDRFRRRREAVKE